MPESGFQLNSTVNLVETGTEELTQKIVLQRLKALANTEFHVENVDFSGFENNLFFPFRELNRLKRELLFHLNGSKEYIAPVKLPALSRQKQQQKHPRLSVLIASEKDLFLREEGDIDLYFQLPSALNHSYSELVDMFSKNQDLIPWFPSILIGEDYSAAVVFLQKVKPKRIVSNNLGIGYEAHILDVPWIAGPYLNITNSYSLIGIQENFECRGAFISNELNNFQINQIKAPENFELHYSIFHPILLMTSRQCFFQTTSGCVKNKIDDSCLPDCTKSTSITDLNDKTFLIKKTTGNYNEIYHETNFLNTEIISGIPDRFFNYLVDLRNIQSKTRIIRDKQKLIAGFTDLINGVSDAKENLSELIQSTTNDQYNRGI